MDSKYPTLYKVVTSSGCASIDLPEKLKIQDEIGQAVLHEVAAWGRALPDDQRRLFIWAVFTCMGHEVAVEITRQTLIVPLLKEGEATLLSAHKEAMAQVQEKRRAVEAREKDLAEAEFAITVKEQALGQANTRLIHQIEQETAARGEAEQALSDRIRDLTDARQEIARLRKIEDAVKLLKSL